MYETEEFKIVLNEALVNKLFSISLDIKYYMNVNSQSTNNECLSYLKTMSDEEVNELTEIRSRIKRLTYKLKSKLDS